MPFAVDLPTPVLNALDEYASANGILSRQQAIVSLLSSALEREGHLHHKPEHGTRPENLTTGNDD